MRNTSEGRSRDFQGLASGKMSAKAVKSRLKSREVTERKQVGDAESMMNEEPNSMQPGGSSEWLE